MKKTKEDSLWGFSWGKRKNILTTNGWILLNCLNCLFQIWTQSENTTSEIFHNREFTPPRDLFNRVVCITKAVRDSAPSLTEKLSDEEIMELVCKIKCNTFGIWTKRLLHSKGSCWICNCSHGRTCLVLSDLLLQPLVCSKLLSLSTWHSTDNASSAWHPTWRDFDYFIHRYQG